MKAISYRKSLVAFVDVMGFKQLLSDTEDNKEKLTRYFNAVKAISEHGNLIGKIDILAVSDSIVYSLPIMEGKEHRDENFFSLVDFINELAKLQVELALELNIWTRGSISVGSLFMAPKENIIVGQAYVDAFNLERSADFARIVLDPKILNEFNYSPHTLTKFLYNEKCTILNFRTDDDFIQVDWFGLALRAKTGVTATS